MTDIPSRLTAIPNRLNISTFSHDPLVLRAVPVDETCRIGSIRASVLSFLIDAVAGISVYDDPEFWTFTSDMSVRMLSIPAPAYVDATATVLRRGHRSSTAEVHVVEPDGGLVGYGILAFSRVPRRPGDPEKPRFDPSAGPLLWDLARPIDVPLPEAIGIQVIDACAGIVAVDIVNELRNPAGAIQGAMVAAIAEVAAEEMISCRLGSPALVCDLDIRYLAQGRLGPVRTSGHWLGNRPTDWVQVQLRDVGTGRLLSQALARSTDPGRELTH